MAVTPIVVTTTTTVTLSILNIIIPSARRPIF